MQRDMDLIRKILIAMQESDRGIAPHISVEGYSDEQIGHHVWLLGDAGLIEATEVTHTGSRSRCSLPVSLNWSGHEFLDSARDERIWSKAKKMAATVGGTLSLALMKQLLDSVIKGELKLH
jgi:hypothetical protein